MIFEEFLDFGKSANGSIGLEQLRHFEHWGVLHPADAGFPCPRIVFRAGIDIEQGAGIGNVRIVAQVQHFLGNFGHGLLPVDMCLVGPVFEIHVDTDGMIAIKFFEAVSGEIFEGKVQVGLHEPSAGHLPDGCLIDAGEDLRMQQVTPWSPLRAPALFGKPLAQVRVLHERGQAGVPAVHEEKRLADDGAEVTGMEGSGMGLEFAGDGGGRFRQLHIIGAESGGNVLQLVTTGESEAMRSQLQPELPCPFLPFWAARRRSRIALLILPVWFCARRIRRSSSGALVCGGDASRILLMGTETIKSSGNSLQGPRA